VKVLCEPDGRPPLRRCAALAAACVAGIVVAGLIDYASGVDARVYPLYYIPIAVGTLWVSLLLGLILAGLSTAFWALAMHLSDAGWGPGLFVFNTAMQTLSFVAIALLVASVARRLQVERGLSRSDALTALANRRAFFELAEVLLAGARRAGRPSTVVYLDLDSFKELNDQRGHREGDLALRTIGDVLRRSTRASDVAARLGGDEFALFLADTGAEAARQVLDRLVESLGAAMRARRWPITASIGALAFIEAPATIDEAVQAADALMYQAKQAGKNRIRLESRGG
jgi:diguanylate cyclase (GGDEF)-like protein